MRSGLVGKVLRYYMEGDSFYYLLETEDQRNIRVKDMGLVLIEGELKYLCSSCGHEDLVKNNFCANCNSELF